uniref:RRM domain-containing protein n=1 Tax=Photinus pyralis TaxID=7054 RepID=A0A1Y1NGR7_PHOPY
MSSEVYNNSYYYGKNEKDQYSQNSDQSQSRSSWGSDTRYMQNYSNTPPQQNYDNGNSVHYSPYHSNTYPVNHFNHSPSGNNYVRFPYPSPNSRGYYRNRYPNVANNQYMGGPGPSYGWQRTQHYKRTRTETGDSDQNLKTTKKKKKPLSQNVPNKKDWTAQDAEVALSTEKAFNKKSKNSLIIKFPDQELSKEIVSQFHPSIENVHFQQPCTPRFCFVTLQESADPEEIINTLNKQKFGEGYLTVEYKKDRDEEQVILADDIDPLTLYVGNLAQEVTKDDIVNLYPNNKRIDIGFAKKMKFTRYAFIGFRTAAESLEAFKRTHCKQMYSKSLIVRFRRLHGTIGMPGEAKPQNPPKTREETPEIPGTASTNGSLNKPEDIPPEADSVGIFEDDLSESLPVNVTSVKREQSSPVSDDESKFEPIFSDRKPPVFDDMIVGESKWNHRPIGKTESNVDVKTESGIKAERQDGNVTVKSEPHESDEELDISNLYRDDDEDEGDGNVNDDDNEEDAFSDMMDFDRIYENMLLHKQKLSTLRRN